MNLKQARDSGKLSQFVKEHAGGPIGDREAFERTLSAMAGTSKSEPGTSKPRRSDD